jgi:hypothetical protein
MPAVWLRGVAVSRAGLVVPLATAVALLASGAVSAMVARAEHESAQETTARVTTYLGIQFSTKRCEGAAAYKINVVSRRWRRRSLRRSVRARYQTFGQGLSCNGDPVQESHGSGVFEPCFGCDGTSRRWTRDYVSFYSWPYLRQCDCDKEHVGALVQTQVRSSRGRILGYGCVKIPLLGQIDSPVC